jgi:hypothetical protein
VTQAIDIGDHRELFVDHTLISTSASRSLLMICSGV